MNAKGWEVCWNCGKQKERCRAASVREVDDRPEIEWICRQCWRDLDYDKYLYEYKQERGDENGNS